MVGREEAETVAIGKHRRACHVERAAPYLLHISHIFAHRLRSVERRDVVAASVEEVVGEAAVESLRQVGSERIFRLAPRASAILSGILLNNLVELLTVGRHHILHVGRILQSSLNLERGGSGCDNFLQTVELVHVLEREQMACPANDVATTVLKVEGEAAELCALATVGASSETMVRSIASPRIAHAQGTMHKHLKLRLRHSLVDSPNLFGREFACQHHSAEPYACEPRHLLGRAVVGLSACVQLRHTHGLHLRLLGYLLHHLHNGHVLHKYSVYLSLHYASQQLLGGSKLMFVDNGVDRNVDPCSKLMGIGSKLRDVVYAVASRLSRSKLIGSYIQGVGTMVDGYDALLKILGWSKKLDGARKVVV